jgi:hypothetical protein
VRPKPRHNDGVISEGGINPTDGNHTTLPGTGLTAHVAYEVANALTFQNLRMAFSCFDYCHTDGPRIVLQNALTLHPPCCTNEEQNTANKKNRLVLDETCRMVDYTEDPNYPHAFQLIVLGGQITWTLAAMTREGKGNFRQTLMQSKASLQQAQQASKS